MISQIRSSFVGARGGGVLGAGPNQLSLSVEGGAREFLIEWPEKRLTGEKLQI